MPERFGQLSCWGKRRYTTELFALQVERSCEEKRPGTSLRVYFCGVCAGYHLTRAATDAQRLDQPDAHQPRATPEQRFRPSQVVPRKYQAAYVSHRVRKLVETPRARRREDERRHRDRKDREDE